MRFCPVCGSRFSNDARFCPYDGEAMSVIDETSNSGLVGQVVAGRYRVESVLGEGGMGIVYRAVHVTLGKTVALKVLRQDMAHDEVVAQRFVQEAKALSRIQHPHVVEVHDFGRTEDGVTYFVMEYLDGRSLRDAIREDALDAREIGIIAKAIAEGLSAAHSAGVIHRDLKPENIQLVRRDGNACFVKVLDFGVAKVAGVSKLTKNGAIFGTPHYMSPEQAQGLAVDVRSDIYSYGIILYELVTGKLPFDADSFVRLLSQQMFDSPPAMELSPAMRRDLGWLEPIVMKCLEKKSGDRFRGFDAVLEALERAEKKAIPRGLYIGGGIAAGLALLGTLALAWTTLDRPDAAHSQVVEGVSASPPPQPAAPSAPAAGTAAAARALEHDPSVHPATHLREPSMVMIESDPPGAAVSLDGIILGMTPVSVPRPLDGAKMLQIEYEGRQAKVFALDAHGPDHLLIRLPSARTRTTKAVGTAPRTAPSGSPTTTTTPTPTHSAPPASRHVSREVVDPWGD
jgi:eukaryotic-like serine/threonine-protein kinase